MVSLHLAPLHSSLQIVERQQQNANNKKETSQRSAILFNPMLKEATYIFHALFPAISNTCIQIDI